MNHRYMANNPADLRAVAESIDALPQAVQPTFAAALVAARLMIFEDPSMELVAETARKADCCFVAMSVWFQQEPEACEAFIMQTSSHCMYGKDTVEQSSVGGWCQEELDKVVVALMIHTN